MKLKRYKKENDLLKDSFYLENKTVKGEELEVTEEINLGYGVAVHKNVNRTKKDDRLKRDLKRVVSPWALQVSPFACIGDKVTNRDLTIPGGGATTGTALEE